MTRSFGQMWAVGLFGVALAGCVATDAGGTEAQTEQALSGPCAKQADVTWTDWDQKTVPTVGSGEMFIAWNDGTNVYAGLTDTASCATSWTVKTPVANRSAFLTSMSDAGQLDVSNKPPPQPPKGNTGVYFPSYAIGIASANATALKEWVLPE